MDRAYIVENEQERARLKALVARLRDDELSLPINATWTVGVALAHLAFWDRLWLAKFEEWEQAGKVVVPQIGDAVHSINDGLVPWWRAMAPAYVKQEVVAAAEAIDTKIASLDEAVVEAVFAVRPRSINRAFHRRSHLEQVEQALSASRQR